MGGFPNSLPDDIQALEPLIARSLVTHTSPNAFLHIQPRLISGQIVEPQASMRAEKLLHVCARMPPGSVDIQPDGVSPKSAV